MKYDDVSWHTSADEYPKGLPPEAAATHTGMFLAWAILAGLGGEVFDDQDRERLKTRAVTPGRFFLDAGDGKLVDEELSEEGNRFTQAYFDLENGQYLHDYDAVLCRGLQIAYQAPDTWENFDRLKPMLDRRLAQWRAGKLGRPWWKFW